jgi:hypothetical protein
MRDPTDPVVSAASRLAEAAGAAACVSGNGVARATCAEASPCFGVERSASLGLATAFDIRPGLFVAWRAGRKLRAEHAHRAGCFRPHDVGLPRRSCDGDRSDRDHGNAAGRGQRHRHLVRLEKWQRPIERGAYAIQNRRRK